jgi:uncharacterized protein YhdP
VEASEQGGFLTLSAANTSLDMPQVLVGPVPLDSLQVKGSWTTRDGLPKIALDQSLEDMIEKT